MTEEQKVTRVSDMLRVTANTTIGLMGRIADHIDQLEAEVESLRARVKELEGTPNDSESQ